MSLELIERAVAMGIVPSEVDFLKQPADVRAAILAAVAGNGGPGDVVAPPAPTEEQWHVIRDAQGNVIG